jgi:hypothetical protein
MVRADYAEFFGHCRLKLLPEGGDKRIPVLIRRAASRPVLTSLTSARARPGSPDHPEIKLANAGRNGAIIAIWSAAIETNFW